MPTGSAPRCHRAGDPAQVHQDRADGQSQPGAEDRERTQQPGRTARRDGSAAGPSNTAVRSGDSERFSPELQHDGGQEGDRADDGAARRSPAPRRAGGPGRCRRATSRPDAAYEEAKAAPAVSDHRAVDPPLLDLRGRPSSSCASIRRPAMVAMTSGMAVDNQGVSELVAGPTRRSAPLAAARRRSDGQRPGPVHRALALATQASSTGRAMTSSDTSAAELPATAGRHRRATACLRSRERW
jgi:hypothetical protein